MAPKLDLVYSSQRGNGMLGVGWSLSGLSAVTRCAATNAQDALKGAINFDANDKLCLDGQRLMLVPGTGSYGAAGSQYRTEIDSFSKIVANGAVGTGPASFTVKTKSGLTIEYGNTADSRIEAVKVSAGAPWVAGTVRAWAQNKVIDLAGNYLTVSYDEDTINGTYYPSRIDYTGNANSSPVLATTASVLFNTDGSRLDANVGYSAGALFKSSKRINAVRTYLGTTLVKEYRLAYVAQSASANQSKLASITECDVGGTCLAPVSISWGVSGTNGFAAPVTWLGAQFGTNPYTDNNLFPRFLADTNGDGLPDIVAFGPQGVSVAINAGNNTFYAPTLALANQFTAAQGFSDNTSAPRYLLDVNGDGFADIVGFNTTGAFVSLNKGDGTFAIPSVWVGGSVGVRFSPGGLKYLVDVNGDGLPDIVGFDGIGVHVALNSGVGFSPPSYWVNGQFGNAQGFVDSLTTPIFVADVNGDGLPDIVGFSATGVIVAINTGSGFVLPSSTQTSWTLAQFGVNQGYADNKVAPRLMADVNGDGLPDIVGFGADGVMVSINTGAGFSAPVSWLATQYGPAQGYANTDIAPRSLVDINGDGLPDIVGFFATGVMVSTNNGAGFDSPVSWVNAFGPGSGSWVNNVANPRFVVDLNGDGVPDVVGFNGTDVVVAKNLRTPLGNFVASVTASTGAVSTATYSALTTQSSNPVYTKDTGTYAATYPLADVIAPFYVVSATTTSNDLGGISSTSYTYGGLKVDQSSGRGLLGFRWVNSHDQGTGIDRYSEYRQDWPYIGIPTLRESRLSGSGSSGVLRRTTASLGCQIPLTSSACTVQPGASYFPYTGSLIDASWDINGAILPVSSTAYTYEQSIQFGDPTQIVVATDDGLSKTTTNTYSAADTTNWTAPRLQQSSVLSSATSGNQRRTNSYTYNAFGLVSTQTQEPMTPAYCLQTTYLYDGFGNLTRSSASACAGATAPTTNSAVTRWKSSSFGTDGHFPLINTNALSQSESRVYDSRFGLPTSLTGPNGLTTAWSYDNFARKTREVRADGTSTSWSYKLCTDTGAACPASVAGAIPKWVQIEQSYAAGTPGAGGVPTTSTTVSAPEKRQFFDALNHPVRLQSLGFDGTGATPTLVQDTQYNALGQVYKQSNVYALSGGTAVWTTYTYDALGRTVTESRPDAVAAAGVATTTTSYNGLSITTQNANGQVKTTTRDSQGRVASVTDAQGSQIIYSYDAFDNLLSANAAGSITAMQYDNLGRKVAMQDPAMGSWTYSYNAFGDMVSQRDSLNQTTTMSYDVLGRLTQRLEPDLNSQWSFDTRFDAAPCGKGIGKLCEAKTASGYSRKLSYDALGRLSNTSVALDNPASPAVLSQTYDAAGRISTKTWPTGYQANYVYSALGYLTAVNGGGTNGFTTTTGYQVQAMDAAGHVTQYKLGGKVTTVKSYAADTQRLSGQIATTDGQATGNVLNQTYAYDALGNLTTRNDTTPGVGTQESFSYDSLNRLSLATLVSGSVSPPASTQVMYDPRGNIAYKSDVGRYWYDPARPNRMTNVTLETASGATVPLSGTRALSYSFDDLTAGSQLVGSTLVGNGNLTYTVTHDTANGRHFVRYETYTSFNMPLSMTYNNFGANTSTCQPGFTLVGGNCTLTSTTTIGPATGRYSCPAGQTLNASGPSCVANTTLAAAQTTTCGAGSVPSGATCAVTATALASPNYTCPAGSAFASATTCATTTTTGATSSPYCTAGSLTFFEGLWCAVDYGGRRGAEYYPPSYSYSCPAGGTLSGTSCITTTTALATIASYSCPSGYNLTAGTTSCVRQTSVAVTTNYVCPSDTVSAGGANCTRKTWYAATAALSCPNGAFFDWDSYTCLISQGRNGTQVPPTVTYSCPSGGTLSATNCVTNTNVAANITGYSCPTGFLRSGGNCTVATPVLAVPNYICPIGYAPAAGSKCAQIAAYAASASPSCPGGTNYEVIEGTDGCYIDYPGKRGTVYVSAVVYIYACPTGGTISGTTCYKTTYAAPAVASYSCPVGYLLFGETCTPSYTVPAATTITCPAGNSCTVTTTTAAPATWSCTVGTLSGRSCVQTSTITSPPGSLNAADRTLSYTYGPEHQRVRQNVTLSGNGTSSYFAGNTWYLNGDDGLDLAYEKELRSNGTTEHRHFLTANGQAFALFSSRTGALNGLAATTTNYLQHDHLGSIVAITDENAAVTERLAYDPWGKRRNIASLPGTADKLDALFGRNTERGYTEAEHLDEVGVIHMNGRIYDPLIGRFMSADPHVTDPYDLRSFNRYTYVDNNPLTFTDPTGYDLDGNSGESEAKSYKEHQGDTNPANWGTNPSGRDVGESAPSASQSTDPNAPPTVGTVNASAAVITPFGFGVSFNLTIAAHIDGRDSSGFITGSINCCVGFGGYAGVGLGAGLQNGGLPPAGVSTSKDAVAEGDLGLGGVGIQVSKVEKLGERAAQITPDSTIAGSAGKIGPAYGGGAIIGNSYSATVGSDTINGLINTINNSMESVKSLLKSLTPHF